MDVSGAKAAVTAYSEASKRLQEAGGGAAAENAAKANDGAAFADMVKGALGASVTAGHGSEAAAVSAVMKDAGLVDVVTAVSSAEMALETVVAVRDRVISAYQDILRMPI